MWAFTPLSTKSEENTLLLSFNTFAILFLPQAHSHISPVNASTDNKACTASMGVS